jgi:hypothetical protein
MVNARSYLTALACFFAAGATGQERTASREAARIESGEVRLVAVVEQAGQVRRVRLEITRGKTGSTVFLTEDTAGKLKTILDNLDRDVEKLRGRVSGYIGSCEFRDHPNEYPITFDYYAGQADPSGLRLSTPNLGFVFLPERRPEDLAAVVTRALEELWPR